MTVRRPRLGAVLLFAVLTVISQVGGVVYLAARWSSAWLTRRFQFTWIARCLVTLVGFCMLYAVVTAAVLPPLATALGRLPLPCSVSLRQGVAPLSRAVCVLNRHYARQPVHDALDQLARYMNIGYPGTVVGYLDANFPLFDGFPMLPHLSHKDGDKIDLAFFFKDPQGRYQPLQTPSPVGYWGFVAPRKGDPLPCAGRRDVVTLRWDMAFLQPFWPSMILDDDRTEAMLLWLAAHARQLQIDKILLEPHLKARFGLNEDVVRFQGCRPARHDDHVHLSLKR